MKFRFLIVLLAFLALACEKEKNITSPLLDYLPQNAAILVKTNDFAVLKSELKNNDFLSKIESTSMYKSIQERVSAFNYLNPVSECLLAFIELGKDNFEFMLVTSSSPELFTLEDVADKSVESIAYEHGSFKKYTVGDISFFSTDIDGKTIICSSQLLTENVIRRPGKAKTNIALKKLYQTSGSVTSTTIFINVNISDSMVSTLVKEDTALNTSSFADWISFDMKMGQDHINLSGVMVANDSVKNYINLFRNSGALTNTTPSFTPMNANGFLSYTFSDYNIFAKNQQKYLDRITVMDTIFNTVEEIGFIDLSIGKAIVLNTYGAESISQFLDNIKASSEDYQGNEIATLRSTDFLNALFNPLVKNFTAKHYSILDNAFVFSENREPLQTIIRNYKNGATYNKTQVFKTAQQRLADEANILYMGNKTGLQQVWGDDFNATTTKDLKNAKLSDYVFAGQMVADDNFYHANVLIQKIESKAKSNTTAPLFTVQLDNDIATEPQFVINHRTNKKEIIVQDTEQNLYLISSEGKVLWKKQLEGSIQGKVKQVDIYKNGRLQLAFTTDSQFYILDRNGEAVKPFVMSYDGGNLNELAVFDYDGQKNYRFVVSQGSKIFMYNSKGAIVDGFKYKLAESAAIGTPKHFRINGKDYLVFTLEDGSFKILNRVGDVRVKVSDKIDFSENDIYLYKNKFSVSDKKGVLYQVDQKGKLSKTNFNLNKDHGMDATSKTLVLMNDNVLSIKGKKVELELGVYTKPRIFYIYDKIYVSVTDIQNQKIYLFDSMAKPIQNFPVYGTSVIDLTDIDNDRKLELVAKDLENSLIVYRMN
ncbi:ribonuclease HII [Spongiimicrobium sp. 3-5]|uniref:ribonuclease HII n=1 Tax=Spongiimicrobium sp. 3-5 TaxID=3332596 RepID=UPI00397E9DFA